MGHMRAFFPKNACCNVATRYALTTPTPVLYMESLADATKGKAKAAEREAEKKKKKDTEGKRTPYKRNEQRTSLAGPVMLRPNALARLQPRACAPLLRAGPLGCLQQRACVP